MGRLADSLQSQINLNLEVDSVSREEDMPTTEDGSQGQCFVASQKSESWRNKTKMSRTMSHDSPLDVFPLIHTEVSSDGRRP
jgi:hypothetical protein